MNCKTCEAVLVLTSVVPEQRDGARSVERHSYLCSACHATEHRLVFTRHGREDDSVPLPAPPPAHASTFDTVIAADRPRRRVGTPHAR